MHDSLGGATLLHDLREYAQHWFKHTALRIGPPHWLKTNAKWVGEMVAARPGFEEELRSIALEALSGQDRELTHRALAALAVVGTKADLDVIEALTNDSDSWLAGAASTAAFEIRRRAD